MECLRYVVCVSCYKELGSQEEVLMCGGCKLWQHWKCTKGVSPSFYSQFYLAVVQQREPAHWQCQYCSKHQSTVDTSPDKSLKKNPSLKIPSNPPPSAEDSSDSDQEDELDMSFDITRTEREGPALYPATSLRQCKVLISPRPVLQDISALPTTYSLCQEHSGQKVVKDCNGNIYKTMEVIKDQAESYQCARVGCQFQVRVNEVLKEFLSAGEFWKEAHNHSVATEDSSDRPTMSNTMVKTTKYSSGNSSKGSDSQPTTHNISARPAKNNFPTRPTKSNIQTRPTKSNLPARPTKSNIPARPTEDCSSVRLPTPYIIQARPSNSKFPTRATKFVLKRVGSHSKMRSPLPNPPSPILPVMDVTPRQMQANRLTRSDTDDLEPLVIHRFQPLTTPKIDKSLADFSFSSSSDSSPDSLNTATLCDKHTDDDDQAMEDSPTPELPPPPSNTTPACQSSNSEGKDELVVSDITYSVTEGTASRDKSKLTDSLGFTYQIKFKLGTRVFWTCAEKIGRCSATIIQQRKNQFNRGTALHNHAANQSQTSTSTRPASTAAVNHSDVGHEKSLASHPREIPTTSGPDCHESFDADDEMMPGKGSTTTHQSKEVDMSTVPEQKTDTPSTPVDNAPLSTAASKTLPAANPTESLNENFQEVTTCTRFLYKPQSVLIDSKGFMYKTKIEDRVKGHTMWKCTHKGPNGSCKGKVRFQVIKVFNDRLGIEDFVWLSRHSGLCSDTKAEPHNHEADWTAAVMLKLKAMIHRQIFGYGKHNTSANDIIERASLSLYNHERVYVPTEKQQLKNLKRLVWRQQCEYRDTPRGELDRYMLER